ncbi:MAG: glycosyltransferase [Muribaculaceae bacterium]|nr:glycosyltransferase [Muribaculaceae bacterium]
METTPLFSIITVTYNAGTTLPPTLASVNSQTLSDYEHLIIDGASKDSTLTIAHADINPRRRIFSEPDSGIYDAMNRGLELAKGQYVIFLNAGDRFHSPDTLKHYADAIQRNNTPGIVYGQTILVDTDGNKLADRHIKAPSELTLASFANGMSVCHQAMAVLKRITMPYNLRYRYSADYEWVIHCLQHSRHNIYIDETVIDYLAEGETTSNRCKSLIERFGIMCHYYGTLPTIWRHIMLIPRFIRHKRHLDKATQAKR